MKVHLLNVDYQLTVFQQDNDPKHTSNVVKNWLEEEEILMLDPWPPNSPNLNPIENLWHQLKVHVGRNKQLKTIQQLKQEIEKVWHEFNEKSEYLENLIRSMLNQVIKSKGYYTEY